MKRHHLHLIATLGLAAMSAPQLSATNPYLPLWEHLPDGEPRVFEDPDTPGKYRAYIIGSHDTSAYRYCGSDIRMWSAPVEDLTDWRDEGPIFTFQADGKWDVMYAPDLVEVPGKDGKKVYYLYPHSRGWGREAMVCVGPTPKGPFTPVNLDPATLRTIEGSVFGFDPSVYIENITDPADPDFDKGFRAYGFWGFQRSQAAQIDQSTMFSVRPGTETIPYFIPAATHQGGIRDPQGTEYPALCADQNPLEFNFFEASSIRKVGNKYVMIFSGFSGPEYGLWNTNSTLRYAYGDSPLGPWRAGGVLVDSRGVVLNEDGSALQETNAAHNTHGSLQEINGQWYVFYHRPPRGFGFARQPMVSPVHVEWDEASVADGGKVVIRGYDPFAPDGIWTARASNGMEYTGAEVTSEGFRIYGLDPYQYYSAGYACYLSNGKAMQDSWDVWDNNMPVLMSSGDIVGFKYFGFGGLDKADRGLKPFEGSKPGDKTKVNLFVTPLADQEVTFDIMLDGPWDNSTWHGKKIASVKMPASSSSEVMRLTADVSDAVDRLDRKHAIYVVARGSDAKDVCRFEGIGFSRKGENLVYPKVPKITVIVDGILVDLPSVPDRMTDGNGYTGYEQYTAEHKCKSAATAKVSARADNPEVDLKVSRMTDADGTPVAKVDCSYKGIPKTYSIRLVN